MHAIAHTNTRQHKEDILSSDDFLHQIQFGAIIVCTINVGEFCSPRWAPRLYRCSTCVRVCLCVISSAECEVGRRDDATTAQPMTVVFINTSTPLECARVNDVFVLVPMQCVGNADGRPRFTQTFSTGDTHP